MIHVDHVPDHYVKCPRCWHYTPEGRWNFDNLCDRCVPILLESFPEHESIIPIIEKLEEQLVRWTTLAALPNVKPYWRELPVWERYVNRDARV